MINVGEVLRNLASYWDIYEYVGTEETDLDDVKEYLMMKLEKAESTARANINGLRKSQYHLFSIDEETGNIAIDEGKFRRFLDGLDMVFGCSVYDANSEVISDLEAKLYRANNDYDWKDRQLTVCEEKKEELEERVQSLSKENTYLKNKLIHTLLNQPVLVSKSGFAMGEASVEALMDSYMKLRDTKADARELILSDEAVLRKRAVKTDKSLLKRFARNLAERLTKFSGIESVRDEFVRQLLEEKWIVVADYRGKNQQFQLVPVDDLKALRKELKSASGPLDQRLENEPNGKAVW